MIFRFVSYQFVKDLYPPNTRFVTVPSNFALKSNPSLLASYVNSLFQLRTDEHFPLCLRCHCYRGNYLFQGLPLSATSLQKWSEEIRIPPHIHEKFNLFASVIMSIWAVAAIATVFFMSLYKSEVSVIIFSSDPGVPGVRSMGPLSVTELPF